MLQATTITTSMSKGTCVITWLQFESMVAIVCKLESCLLLLHVLSFLLLSLEMTKEAKESKWKTHFPI